MTTIQRRISIGDSNDKDKETDISKTCYRGNLSSSRGVCLEHRTLQLQLVSNRSFRNDELNHWSILKLGPRLSCFHWNFQWKFQVTGDSNRLQFHSCHRLLTGFCFRLLTSVHVFRALLPETFTFPDTTSLCIVLHLTTVIVRSHHHSTLHSRSPVMTLINVESGSPVSFIIILPFLHSIGSSWNSQHLH